LLDARAITLATLAAYAREAELYAEFTRAQDFSWWHAWVRERVPPPARLLDLGCGAGRDLTAFASLGYRVRGIEGCAALAEVARQRGAEVEIANLLDLAPEPSCDIVTANAVLHHLPDEVLTRVLTDIRSATLCALVPLGDGEEGWARGRYVRHLSATTWRRQLERAGFTRIDVQPSERWLIVCAR
jgi:trans-aconitate methyltransferase